MAIDSFARVFRKPILPDLRDLPDLSLLRLVRLQVWDKLVARLMSKSCSSFSSFLRCSISASSVVLGDNVSASISGADRSRGDGGFSGDDGRDSKSHVVRRGGGRDAMDCFTTGPESGLAEILAASGLTTKRLPA